MKKEYTGPIEEIIPLGSTGPAPIVKDGLLEFYYESKQLERPKEKK